MNQVPFNKILGHIFCNEFLYGDLFTKQIFFFMSYPSLNTGTTSKPLLCWEVCDSNCIFSEFSPIALTTCIGSLWWLCLCVLRLNDSFCVAVSFYSELTGDRKIGMSIR